MTEYTRTDIVLAEYIKIKMNGCTFMLYCHCSKENNFHDFLYAALDVRPLQKKKSVLKAKRKKHTLLEEQISNFLQGLIHIESEGNNEIG